MSGTQKKKLRKALRVFVDIDEHMHQRDYQNNEECFDETVTRIVRSKSIGQFHKITTACSILGNGRVTSASFALNASVRCN